MQTPRRIGRRRQFAFLIFGHVVHARGCVCCFWIWVARARSSAPWPDPPWMFTSCRVCHGSYVVANQREAVLRRGRRSSPSVCVCQGVFDGHPEGTFVGCYFGARVVWVVALGGSLLLWHGFARFSPGSWVVWISDMGIFGCFQWGFWRRRSSCCGRAGPVVRLPVGCNRRTASERPH
jgi:hypothetical protein